MKQRKHLPEHFERYARYWLSVVESDPENWRAITEHIAPLRSAWNVIVKFPEYSIRYVLALRFFNARQGLGREYLTWGKRALKAARKLGRREDITKLLLAIGLAHERYHELRRALSSYEEALSFSEGTDLEGDTLNNIGLVRGQLGDSLGAIQCLERALSLARDFNDIYSEALTLHNIAAWHGRNSQDRHTEIAWLEQSLKAWTAIEEPWGMATTLNRTGSAYMDLGDTRVALDFYEKALALRNEIGDKPGQWRTLNSIGLLHAHTGERQRALECLAKAHEITVEIKDRYAQAVVLSNLGIFYAESGESRRALWCHRKSLLLHRRQGDTQGEATSLNNIGLVHHSLGNNEKALPLFQDALSLWHRLKNNRGEAATLSNIGLVLLNLGDYKKALACSKRSLAIARTIHYVDQQGIALNNIGLAHSSLGSHKKALAFYEQALAIHRQTGNRSEESVTLSNMAFSNRKMNNWQVAEHLTAEASRIREKINRASNSAVRPRPAKWGLSGLLDSQQVRNWGE